MSKKTDQALSSLRPQKKLREVMMRRVAQVRLAICARMLEGIPSLLRLPMYR
jgi:hypothetical protein